MRLLADENIPLLDPFFASFATLERLPGRRISRDALAGVETLLVRSVTRVDRALLEGTPVRFVGTCTIGTDHLDLEYFQQAGITWASAPGCNARGVVDYVLGALLTLSERSGQSLSSRTYGVVGAGAVGSQLVAVLQTLGWRVLVCDPLREAREGGEFVSFDQVLAACDVISLHTPLTHTGEHATWHLLDRARLQSLRPGTWLINASRGPVIDNQALREHLQAGADLRVVLDVWEHEPQVDLALAALCELATPHIAGYSLDGKLRGTEQIYRAFCAWQGLEAQVALSSLLPPAWLAGLTVHGEADPDWLLRMLCQSVYDPRRDDADLRRSLDPDPQKQQAGFDRLRKEYPLRREIPGLSLQLGVGHQRDALQRVAQALGVSVC
ncbi:4-phosphoerythronate dehydrogenase PdxB [Pseudomonas sp. NW5]|uniref:4-phosphoerythronate dehydrogenase PdxB n=1 Tax=Pseudomonas sp. NW5 TaxID=2934934 RepID=UPI002020C99E|nr:4-phosphoerythronate dehydrogenase PdxB [Pseudomonas sp. NW5]MCL7462952.1 4-phosphoerythronate dehydrogenase PdxB [Pseudomonas sp. NW5]